MIRKLKSAVIAAIALIAGAFTASAEVPLPTGYTQIEYIQSTGSQYINTELSTTDKMTIDISFSHFKDNYDATLCGNGTYGNKAYMWIDQNGFCIYGGSAGRVSSAVDATALYRATWDEKNVCTLYENGTQVGSKTLSRTSNNGTLWIFKANNNKCKYAEMRLYAL